MAISTGLLRSAAAAVFAVIAAAPAYAGSVTVPAPLVGAGLPALALFGAGYWAVRKFRRG